jgi:multidrug efflux pump subunit AcrA (membrane-fusion protein)
VQVRSAGPQSWFVAAGLQPGERVVLDGALYLNHMVDAER